MYYLNYNGKNGILCKNELYVIQLAGLNGICSSKRKLSLVKVIDNIENTERQIEANFPKWISHTCDLN